MKNITNSEPGRFVAATLLLCWLASAGTVAAQLTITQRGAWTGIGIGVAQELKLQDGRLYVAGDGAGLIELDVSQPENPFKSAAIAPPDILAIRSLDVAGDVMVVGHSFGSSSREFLRTVDPSIARTPSILGSVIGSGSVAGAGVVIAGSHAFVVVQDFNDPDTVLSSTRETLKIVDISNPNSPTLVAERDILDGTVNSPGRAVFFSNGWLYALTKNILRIYDITSPVNPVVLGERQLGTDATDLFVSGTTAYVGQGSGGVLILETSNPNNIVSLGLVTTSGSANGMEVVGNVLYVAAGAAGVELSDVTDPANPASLGGFATTDARDLLVAGNLVYVADGSAGVKVLQVMDAAAGGPAITAQPQSCKVLPGEACSLVVGAVGLAPLNYQWRLNGNPIANATNAQLHVTQFAAANVGNYDVVVTNAQGSVTSAIAAANLITVAALNQRGAWSGIGIGVAHELELKEQRLFVAGDGAGLIELNVANPGAPFKAGEITSPQILPIRALDNVGNVMVVGHSFNNSSREFIRKIDTTVSGAPTVLASVLGSGAVAGAGVVIHGSHAFVVVQDSNDPAAVLSSTRETLKVVDLSNPNSPTLVAEQDILDGTVNSPGRAVTIGNGWLYALTKKGLRVYDITTPANPVLLGERVITGDKTDIDVVGTTAFIGLGAGGVLILNTSNPNHMTALGVVPTQGAATGVQAVGNRLYVASGLTGVELFDISNFAAPFRTAVFDTQDARDVLVVDRTIYVADGSAGVKVLNRIDAPVFSTHPVSQRVPVGSGVTFTAAASESPTYQWQKDGVDIPGAISQVYSISSVAIADGGAYRCVASNGAGAVLSQPANLIIAVPPTVTITQPTAVSTFHAPATFDIQVQAVDSDGTVAKVELFRGATKLSEDFNAPYSFSITDLAVGTHMFFVQATDNEARTSAPAQITVIVEPANLAPTVSLSVTNTSFIEPAAFALNATAADADGAIAKVEFFEGTNKIGEAVMAPFSLPIANLAARTDPYVYTAQATDNDGAVSPLSTAVNVGVHTRVRATQESAGYHAGGEAFVNVTIHHLGNLTSLIYSMTLPAGWTFLSGDSTALVKPVANAQGTLQWGWVGNFPPSPYSFTVRVGAPVGTSGVQQITGEVIAREGGPELRATTSPDPLDVAPLLFHSADSDQDFRISLNELLRVVSLYNYSSNNVRTGEFHAQGGTEDGYAPGPGSQAGMAHSADSSGDWSLDLSELLRVVSLFSYSANDQRTGQYHPVTGSVDGFAAGPPGLQSAGLMRVPFGPATESATLTSGVTQYLAGNTVSVNLRAEHTGNLTAMGWEVDLPAGWSYNADNSSAALRPLTNHQGTITWAWLSGFPTSPDAFDLVLNVPADATGDQTLQARLLLRDPARTLSAQLTLSEGFVVPPPVITSAPMGAFIEPGETVVLSVAAQGAGLTYQWRFNGVDIPNETGTSLTVTNGTVAIAGEYSVVVSNGTTTSTRTATVRYFGDLNFYPAMFIGGRIGDVFHIEYAEVLGSSTNWMSLTNLTHPGGVFFFVDRTGTNQTRRFYRSSLVPAP